MKPQELATIVYSYSKAETASPEIIMELLPTILKHMDSMKPRELVSVLMALTSCGFFELKEDGKEGLKIPSNLDPKAVLERFESQFNARHDMMNAEDICKYYYCFTLALGGF
jgi:ADP-dependent phosphofructokinase/glucokinase